MSKVRLKGSKPRLTLLELFLVIIGYKPYLWRLSA